MSSPKRKAYLRAECKSDPKCYSQQRVLYRDNALKRYGLTTAKYMELAHQQDFRCAVCGKHEADGYKYGLVVEHDHETNTVRGLVCPHCNAMIGWYEANRLAVTKHLGG